MTISYTKIGGSTASCDAHEAPLGKDVIKVSNTKLYSREHT
jgi:hypothetical protein